MDIFIYTFYGYLYRSDQMLIVIAVFLGEERVNHGPEMTIQDIM